MSEWCTRRHLDTDELFLYAGLVVAGSLLTEVGSFFNSSYARR